jgi:hypothetical protein
LGHHTSQCVQQVILSTARLLLVPILNLLLSAILLSVYSEMVSCW